MSRRSTFRAVALRVDEVHPCGPDHDVVDVAVSPRHAAVVERDDVVAPDERPGEALLAFGPALPRARRLRLRADDRLGSQRRREPTQDRVIPLHPRTPCGVAVDHGLLAEHLPARTLLILRHRRRTGKAGIDGRRALVARHARRRSCLGVPPGVRAGSERCLALDALAVPPQPQLPLAHAPPSAPSTQNLTSSRRAGTVPVDTGPGPAETLSCGCSAD
jgi:hypothetical protein